MLRSQRLELQSMIATTMWRWKCYLFKRRIDDASVRQCSHVDEWHRNIRTPHFDQRVPSLCSE